MLGRIIMEKLLVNDEDYVRVLRYIESRDMPVYWYTLRNLALHDSDNTPVLQFLGQRQHRAVHII
jgi:hypothetical protein